MSRGKWLFLLGMAAAIIFFDQVTKAAVVATLAPYESFAPIAALSDYLTITHITNTGAAFGILPDGGALFLVVALIVVVIILYFYRELTSEVWLARVALGLQLGGAVGNLIDRVRQGYVVDFVHFKLSDTLSWPVFNVADSSIFIGVGLLLLIMWHEDRRQKKAQEAAESALSEDASPHDESSPTTLHMTPAPRQEPMSHE